jgi:hypothetical protein
MLALPAALDQPKPKDNPMLKRTLLLAALVAFTAPALAVLQLSADINGTIFSCVDQAACDTNLAVGQLQIANQTINGVEIVGSSQFDVAGPTNFLNTSSFQFINHNLTAATVQLAIGGTNFIGPVNHYASSGSGTWQSASGSNIAMQWFADALNGQGADTPLDFPGILLASFGDTAASDADAFATNSAGAFLAAGLHSMTLGTSGTLTAWDGIAGDESVLVGRAQTLLTTQVPEPATLALMGLALAGMGFVRRRTA